MPSKSKTQMAKAIKGGLANTIKEANKLINTGKRPSPSQMREAMMVYFQENNYDPIQELINIAKGEPFKATRPAPTEGDPHNTVEVDVYPTITERASIHKEFLKFIAPGMKVTDPLANEQQNIHVTINNFGKPEEKEVVETDEY
jgi:hypothetical protein